MNKKLLLLIVLSTFLHANMVWPALYLEIRLFSWWAIAIGFFIEYFFVLKLLVNDKVKALKATFFANLVSAILGVILIPLSGIAWELFPGSVFYLVFNLGTFNPITWTATFILAILVNVIVEGYVYKRYLKLETFLKSKKLFFLFFLANCVSVGVAMASLYFKPLYL